MTKATISFSNGDKVIISEGQRIIPICRHTYKEELTTSQGMPVEMWSHIQEGLIPCITAFLLNCDFFRVDQESEKVYSSSSVVTIENI
jgi:hypothetical protein